MIGIVIGIEFSELVFELVDDLMLTVNFAVGSGTDDHHQ